LNDNQWIDHAFASLIRLLTKLPEVRRQALVLSAFKKAGHLLVNPELISEIISKQKEDGGWGDISETFLALYLICDVIDQRSAFERGIIWLDANKVNNVAWGNSVRDIARIPVTGLLLTFLPLLADEESLLWLENELIKEMSSDTRLTYKAAIALMAFSTLDRSPIDISLVPCTLDYLVKEQNVDGGFSPWRAHPIGSEPWSTGIALLGLLSHPQLVDSDVIARSTEWLMRNQLPNGLWPCHYIEEGSAYCYWAATQAIRFLNKDSS
jgi:squalene cyclase